MGKPFVCDICAFIHLETDNYKKIVISKKIEIYKFAGCPKVGSKNFRLE